MVIRFSLGTVSLSRAKRLASRSAFSEDKPVMFAPGCATLRMSPAMTGSPVVINTIGIVFVGLGRLSRFHATGGHNEVDRSVNEVRDRGRQPLAISPSEAVLDNEGLALDPAELP
jgi:hypothetical protein